MGTMILVTGGARSGKSTFAEQLCKEMKGPTAYIATATAFDEEMKERIRKHQQRRPKEWKTYEVYKDIYKWIPEIQKEHQVALLDCITLLVNNLMFEDWEEDLSVERINELEQKIQEQIQLLIQAVKKSSITFICVTNEIGMSVVAANALTRAYTDIVGRVNQLLAKNSDSVYFVVSGIPMKIKGEL